MWNIKVWYYLSNREVLKLQARAKFSLGRICRQHLPMRYEVRKNRHRHDVCIQKWQQLTFLTQAESPQKLEGALEAAKLGEAYGYRDAIPETHTVAAARPASNAEMEQKWMI